MFKREYFCHFMTRNPFAFIFWNDCLEKSRSSLCVLVAGKLGFNCVWDSDFMRNISQFKVINFHSFTDPSVAFSEMCTDQFYIHRVRADTGSDPDKDYFNILTAQGCWYNNAMDEYELNLITCEQHELELNTQLNRTLLRYDNVDEASPATHWRDPGLIAAARWRISVLNKMFRCEMLTFQI